MVSLKSNFTVNRFCICYKTGHNESPGLSENIFTQI